MDESLRRIKSGSWGIQRVDWRFTKYQGNIWEDLGNRKIEISSNYIDLIVCQAAFLDYTGQ